ncbi:MAG: pentapeptide repeat-containing protein, partial [Gammaproteobacteria bacterium]|nr:pentapeptide repeat-containing protein [Gammaproteobacteria bacterium]
NMRGADLSDADLSNAVMGGAILRRAIVSNANFKDVELATVTMDYANFSKALNADVPSYKPNLR